MWIDTKTSNAATRPIGIAHGWDVTTDVRELWANALQFTLPPTGTTILIK